MVEGKNKGVVSDTVERHHSYDSLIFYPQVGNVCKYHVYNFLVEKKKRRKKKKLKKSKETRGGVVERLSRSKDGRRVDAPLACH